VNKTGAAQSEIRIGEVGLTRSTPDYHPLIVLNMVLGGQFVSRINLKLRQEKGLTYGARTSFDFRRGRGPFILQTSVQSDGTAEAVQAALNEIDAIRGERPPTPQEVETAKTALTRGYARNFETAEQVARAMAQLLLSGCRTILRHVCHPSERGGSRAGAEAASTHLNPRNWPRPSWPTLRW
jgi:predicted Zn-dependent peptidase